MRKTSRAVRLRAYAPSVAWQDCVDAVKSKLCTNLGADGQRPVLAEAGVLAATAVELASRFATWVRRRKWTLEYVDDTTIRQRMSIDFRLPPEDRLAAPPGRGQTIFVPLWIPKKGPLTNLDVRDEEDRAVAVLNRVENGRVTARGLQFLMLGIAAGKSVDVDETDLATVLSEIVTARPGDAESRLEGALGSTLAMLEKGDEYETFVRELARGFLLMVPLPYEPGRDRILKLAFDTPQLWHGEEPDWRERWRSLRASLGLADKSQQFEELPIGLARGNHFQLNAPPGVKLAEAWIDVWQHYPDPTGDVISRNEQASPREQSVFDRPRAELNVSPRAVYDPDLPDLPDEGEAARRTAYGDLLAGMADKANLHVRFIPRASDVFAGALVTCVLTIPLLWVVDRRLIQLDGQTSAALLLALPAILAAFLARPGEHAFAARLIFGVRLTALVVGTCALGVAAVIGAGGIREGSPAPARSATAVPCGGRGFARLPPAPGWARTVVCRTPTRSHVHANATAQRSVTGLAVIATLGTVLLLVGFVRTLLADYDRRNREIEPAP